MKQLELTFFGMGIPSISDLDRGPLGAAGEACCCVFFFRISSYVISYDVTVPALADSFPKILARVPVKARVCPAPRVIGPIFAVARALAIRHLHLALARLTLIYV